MTLAPTAATHCERGCGRHYARTTDVTIGGPTMFADLTPIPERYARTLTFNVWDLDEHPHSPGPYCPARDVVSETLVSHGVWEPVESVLALWAVENRPGVFVDMGAHVGWFTLLAATSDRQVIAYEADPDNRTLLQANLVENDVENMVDVRAEWVGPDADEIWPPLEVCMAKMDVEGAEDQAVRILWPSIKAGLVHSILMEVSPVFADYYPGLLNRIVNQGYEAYQMPPKVHPAVVVESPADLAPYRFDQLEPADLADMASRWHQTDVLLVRSP